MNVASLNRIALSYCLAGLFAVILLAGVVCGQVVEPNRDEPAKTDGDLDRLITKLVLESIPPVSYTHLTLPTICSV